MASQSARQHVTDLLSVAGIKVNGHAPWDIQVYNEKLYQRLFDGGSLALGESYMDKWWDCEKPDEFFSHILKSDLENVIKNSPILLARIMLTKVLNFQTR